MAIEEKYSKAQEKIETALYSGATDLDFIDIPLTKLPESLGQLTQLKSLDISRKQLTILPESLGQLTQLKSLYLYENRLTALPKSLWQLTQLKKLLMFSNQLTDLPESLGQLSQLTDLFIGNNHLKALPESLGQLTKLKVLRVYYNRITALPESLSQLTLLQDLDISVNEISTLSESLGQLTLLKSLDISNNKLTVLPESLGQLTLLESLDISNNKLTILPESLGHLSQLKSLNISSNKLTILPEWLGHLKHLKSLNISETQVTTLPESLGQLTLLESLDISNNQLTILPEWLGQLTQLKSLNINNKQLSALPESLGQLKRLNSLNIRGTQLTTMPEFLGQLTQLESLNISNNKLTTLPESLGKLQHLTKLNLKDNPLDPELDAANKEGIGAVKRYLRAKAEAHVVLNEAKLILVGEGEVGKSCLLSALCGDKWIENRDTTHGIEIKQVIVTDPMTGIEITLNGWDFGGQRVYRPTHQLFFSAPAVYLVVWKPREGPQQGFVKDWIRLIKYREPDAKILIVATHGGPGARQPDIDRQEIWDLYGKDSVIDFFHVDSKPQNYDMNTDQWTGEYKGIKDLKDTIAKLAIGLPEVGRSVPKRWKEVRVALKQTEEAHLPLDRVLSICTEYKMSNEEAKDFIRISHRLGLLIYYEHDPRLKEVVILKPNWLATAISFVLDDKETRNKHGLVQFSRLSKLWSDATRTPEFHYPSKVHPMFLALMERFDLSYHVVMSPLSGLSNDTSLIAQLVPDVRPDADIAREWPMKPQQGDEQQVQICRIVDEKGHTATAEGLFYQLIVRLHKFSLGCEDFNRSVHWQRGLILDDDYNGRAMLEYIGNDVRITIRAPYPGNMLAVLTREVKWLVENFWEGLKCEVVVPCIDPCGKNMPGTGVFEVQKLITFKRKGLALYPCNVSGCDQFQNIDCLLKNAPIARRPAIELLLAEGFAEMRSRLEELRLQNIMLDISMKRIMSQVEDAFISLMNTMTDEGKEGPRLFSMEPVERSKFNPTGWVKKKFRVTLWCEHTRLPLPLINKNDKEGVYEFDVTREWFVAAAPFLKVLAGTLSLMLPVAASVTKMAVDEATYKGLENQLDFGKECAKAMHDLAEKSGDWFAEKDGPASESMGFINAQGGFLRVFHDWIKKEDPGFGDLRRVLNKQKEFMWVHRDYEKEY